MPVRIERLDGLSELLEALQSELPKATSTNVIKRTLTNAADPFESTAYRLAPHMTGKLQRSIMVGTKLSTTQRNKFPKISKVEIYVGPGTLVQAITQEFGTVRQRPQPFLRPAWSENVKAVLDSIRGELADQIEKARQRAARKAARLLDQMKST